MGEGNQRLTRDRLRPGVERRARRSLSFGCVHGSQPSKRDAAFARSRPLARRSVRVGAQSVRLHTSCRFPHELRRGSCGLARRLLEPSDMNASRIAAVLLTILSATACVAAEPGDIEYPVVDESAPPVVVTADPPPAPVEVVPVVAPRRRQGLGTWLLVVGPARLRLGPRTLGRRAPGRRGGGAALRVPRWPPLLLRSALDPSSLGPEQE